MNNRRSLIEGIHPEEDIDPEAAEQFISGRKPRQPAKLSTPTPIVVRPTREEPPAQLPLPEAITAAAQVPAASPLTGVGRVPVGARVRTELASALKRASLERQLQGVQPNSIQEILEDALELWLHKHGLLR